MNFSRRINAFKLFIYGSASLLILGLLQVQIIRGGYYRHASERNRIRLIPVPALRGRVLDRNGLLFATNRPAYHVYIIPEDFDPQDLPVLSRLLGISVDEIRNRISTPRLQSLTPVVIKKGVSKEVAMQIEERKPSLTGIFIQVEGIRYYPNQDMNGHVLGYIGKITKEEYQRLIVKSSGFIPMWVEWALKKVLTQLCVVKMAGVRSKLMQEESSLMF